MTRISRLKTLVPLLVFSFYLHFILAASGQETTANWGPVQRITFAKDELPPNLFSKFMEKEKNSFLQYCLPEGYSSDKTYPLILYVPGFHGHPGGNIKVAKDIGVDRDCVVASLPLFKKNIDRSEPANGVIVSFADYPILSSSYRKMLGRLFEAVPNIDPTRSAMVGFSNGAITISILVSSQDAFILERFQSYCLVDQGMLHLVDLHKTPTKDRRFLLLVGDEEDYGRSLKLRGAKLLEDSYQLIGIDFESRVLENTGHELTPSCKHDIGAWIFEKDEQTLQKIN